MYQSGTCSGACGRGQSRHLQLDSLRWLVVSVSESKRFCYRRALGTETCCGCLRATSGVRRDLYCKRVLRWIRRLFRKVGASYQVAGSRRVQTQTGKVKEPRVGAGQPQAMNQSKDKSFKQLKADRNVVESRLPYLRGPDVLPAHFYSRAVSSLSHWIESRV